MDINLDDIMGRGKNSLDKLLAELGKRSIEIITPYGVIIFCFDVANQKSIFMNLAAKYIAMFNEVPVTAEDLLKRGLIPEDAEDTDAEVSFRSETEEVEVRKIADKAFDYFNANLISMFEDTMQRYVEECYALGVLRSAGENYYALTVSECEFFRRFSKFANESLRARMKIENQIPRKPLKWTPEKLLTTLAVYEDLHELIEDAKEYYRTLEAKAFRRVHNQEERTKRILNRVKMAHPELEEKIIDKFVYETETEGILAMRLVKKKMNLKIKITSLTTKLSDARKLKRRMSKGVKTEELNEV